MRTLYIDKNRCYNKYSQRETGDNKSFHLKGERIMEQLVQHLNVFLSNVAVLHRKLQNYHWNITGPHFFTLHKKLEEYYEQANEDVDVVAEEILKLQGQPLATMESYLTAATLKEPGNKKVTVEEVVSDLLADFEAMKKEIIAIKEEAEDKKVYEVSTMADDFIAEYSKTLWMLRQAYRE